jgi:hypothetical protein
MVMPALTGDYPRYFIFGPVAFSAATNQYARGGLSSGEVAASLAARAQRQPLQQRLVHARVKGRQARRLAHGAHCVRRQQLARQPQAEVVGHPDQAAGTLASENLLPLDEASQRLSELMSTAGSTIASISVSPSC